MSVFAVDAYKSNRSSASERKKTMESKRDSDPPFGYCDSVEVPIKVSRMSAIDRDVSVAVIENMTHAFPAEMKASFSQHMQMSRLTHRNGTHNQPYF